MDVEALTKVLMMTMFNAAMPRFECMHFVFNGIIVFLLLLILLVIIS